MTVDEKIFTRANARAGRDWGLCDRLRDELDLELVFTFDTPTGQEVYYLTDKFFRKKPEKISNRKYLEQRIQSDIRAEKLLNAWLISTRASK